MSLLPQWEWVELCSWLSELDGVIQGGESGPAAERFDVEWAERLQQVCRDLGIPYFLSQLGSAAFRGNDRIELVDPRGADPTEWPEHLRIRHVPVPISDEKPRKVRRLVPADVPEPKVASEESRPPFRLASAHQPKGGQPAAIAALTQGVRDRKTFQAYQGVTAAGKTLVMANVIANTQRPALIVAPTVTLAAQLHIELKSLFPNNGVYLFFSDYRLFISEAYNRDDDVYTDKLASLDERVTRLRTAAYMGLVTRKDVIVVASVSAIFGLGSPDDYRNGLIPLAVGQSMARDELINRLSQVRYKHSDSSLCAGQFRFRGNCVDVHPPSEACAYRIEFWGNEIEKLTKIDPQRGDVIERCEQLIIPPAYVSILAESRVDEAIAGIQAELAERVNELTAQGKHAEAQCLRDCTLADIARLQASAHCPGLENYDRHLTGRAAGEPGPSLVDFMPKPFTLFVDESHYTIPHFQAMYASDQSRKQRLVDAGYRLPSCLDFRPLTVAEMEQQAENVIFVSATIGEYELEKTGGELVEQVLRPTGLLDPVLKVELRDDPIPHLLQQIRQRVELGERVLVTTVTKPHAEEISGVVSADGIKCRWLHNDLERLERPGVLRDLQQGHFDVLVAVNLVREGIDPLEVSLVAILRADEAPMFRNETSLIQMIGRAARNENGTAILYARRMTPAMEGAIEKTAQRRQVQQQYNDGHGITPQTIDKPIRDGLLSILEDYGSDLEVVRSGGRDERTDGGSTNAGGVEMPVAATQCSEPVRNG